MSGIINNESGDPLKDAQLEKTQQDIVEALESEYDPLPDEPRVNFYQCRECGGRIYTVDCAKGTTPMALGCLAEEGQASNIVLMSGAPAKERCKGTMSSGWYACPPGSYQLEDIKYEWRLPSVLQYAEMKRKSPALAHHVLHGGLILHKRSDTPVMTHGEKFVRDGKEIEEEELKEVLGTFGLLRELVAMELKNKAHFDKRANHEARMRRQKEKRAKREKRRSQRRNHK